MATAKRFKGTGTRFGANGKSKSKKTSGKQSAATRQAYAMAKRKGGELYGTGGS